MTNEQKAKLKVRALNTKIHTAWKQYAVVKRVERKAEWSSDQLEAKIEKLENKLEKAMQASGML